MATAAATPATARRPTLPVDVRLMNGVSLLIVRARRVGAGRGAGGVAAARAAVHDARHRARQATSRAATWPRCAPMRCRSWVATSSASTSTAAARAFESVPWVRHAVVRRVWPNRLAVTLEEHRAAALWQGLGTTTGSESLVNGHGEVFEANLGDVEDEDLLDAERPRQAVRHSDAGHAAQAAEPLATDRRAQIDALQPDEPRLLARRARQRRQHRTRPRPSRTRCSRAPQRFVRTLCAGAAAFRQRRRARATARGRPAPPRRLCPAPARRVDHALAAADNNAPR